MASEPTIEAQVEQILARADEREQRRAARRAALTEAGDPTRVLATRGAAPVLVAEGDSWFDYPGSDVLAELEEVYGFDIASVAHHGDTLESMAYGDKQLDGLNRALAKVARRGVTPTAVLLSGGGNDIAGDEFAILLNHFRSGLEALNEDVVRGLIDVRLRAAYVALILKVGGLCRRHFGRADIPVVVHGYSHPVPDGRGFMGGWAFLPGPWLEPGFRRKGYELLPVNTGTMQVLIDRFNHMVATLRGEPGFDHVHVVDVRPALSNDLVDDRYKGSWANELHPVERGFEAVADRFAQVLARL